MIWSWLHRNPRLADIGLVCVLLFLGVAAALRNGHDHRLTVVFAVAETVPLLLRRRFPLGVVLSVAAIALAMVALEIWLLPLQLGVALYTLSSSGSGRRERTVAAGVIVALGVAVLATGGLEFGAAAARVVFLVAATLLGESVGSRRAYVRAIEEKAARLEREQETERQRAAAEEQARIGRELHDVVAHALSVIIVQASAADDAFGHDPAQARAPIRAVSDAARTALADLRRVLGIVNERPDYEPQPRLDQVDRLVDRVRATGLRVSLAIEGTPQRLPAALDLSAYRIVQEALTNSLKHAAAEHVSIRIRYGETLLLDIHDDGRGSANGGAPPRNGKGLIGMRERVALLGGTLSAGAGANGGYRVTATIPLDSAA
jgi:signal transduction histidine kinase